MPKLADLIAARQTDRRGHCPECKRDEEVPLNEVGICFPCHIETPGLGAAIDQAAQRQLDHILGKGKPGEN